jgi:hypothetical protein
VHQHSGDQLGIASPAEASFGEAFDDRGAEILSVFWARDGEGRTRNCPLSIRLSSSSWH